MVKSKTTVMAATTTTLLFLSEGGEARQRSSSPRQQQQTRGRRRRSVSAPASSSRMSLKASSEAVSSATPAAAASAEKTLFGCGTTLSHALHNLSPSTLCLGLDMYCPQLQVCYALPPLSSSSKNVQEELLARQGILEKEWMDRFMTNREELRQERTKVQHGIEEEFVCGLDWDHAVQSVCQENTLDTLSSSSSALILSSVSKSSHPIHYCPSGLSSQCPQDMECYASVSCDSMLQQQQQQESEAIAIEDERSDKNRSSSSLDDASEEKNEDASSVSWFGYHHSSSLWNSISFSS